MKILFISSEVTPFAKTGGLADVTGSLPKELKRMGHDVRIILPFYKMIQNGPWEIAPEGYNSQVHLAGAVETGVLHRTSVEGIPVWLLENENFFGRDFLYGTPDDDYPDNLQRFAFFCRWTADFLEKGDFRPDIIHCHDWQTALVPLFLSDNYREKNSVIFTIHNLAFQGIFPKVSFTNLGFDFSETALELLEFYGNINLMKGAILSADLVNTVSESYCREIQTEEFGCGLEGVLQSRRHDLSGIVNGIDYTEWNPAADPDLFLHFSAAEPTGKAANKKVLQQLLGLEESANTPLLGIVSRLSAQKGFNLIAKILPRITAEKFQLVILGSGEEEFIQLLTKMKGAGTKSFSFNFGFDSGLAHKIYAGCDILLMPSQFEPCGLSQLIAMRYGTVPVVRKTGGLADTVKDPRDAPAATGFSFETYSSVSLWATIMRALRTRKDMKSWKKIVRQGMKTDFSWGVSALRYEELYRLGLKKKGIINASGKRTARRTDPGNQEGHS